MAGKVWMNLQEQAEYVEEFGSSMYWYERTLCPCLVTNGGHPDPDCDCYGGFRYADPVEVVVLRVEVNFRHLPADIGMILQGGCKLTIPALKVVRDVEGNIKEYKEDPLHERVTRGDIFAEMNNSRRDGDLLVRGSRDRLFSFDVDKILRVTTKTTEYADHGDYTFDPTTRTISWVSGHGPATGTPYTVEFTSKVQYIVWDDQAMHRGSDANPLPRRIYCRLRQYIDFEFDNPIDQLKNLSVN